MSRDETRANARPGRGRPRFPAQGRRGAAPMPARMVALRVLERVDQSGAFADLTLRAALGAGGLPPGERALATELVYGTLRWRGRLDYVLAPRVDRDFARIQPPVRALLRLGTYQLLFTERIPAATAVDQTVRVARAAGLDRAAGLANAVLRRVARDRDTLTWPELADDPLGHLVHALSLPPWLAERWLERYGAEQAAALARASNQAPPLCVRVNRRKSTREALLAEVATRFPDAHACRLAPHGVVLGRKGRPGLDPAFLDGRFTVQDEASQLVVSLLDPQPGERVLDVCAAPGGKATAIAERVGERGRVLALDRHGARLRLVSRDARRLGLENLETRELDAASPLRALGDERFDRVLVDAPCSGLGTLRRHPDARWRVRPQDPGQLARTQLALLHAAADVLRPGGTLVYSTCTLAPEENEGVIEALLSGAETPESRSLRRAPRAALPDGLDPVLDAEGTLRTFPHRDDTDGFFAVRLERPA